MKVIQSTLLPSLFSVYIFFPHLIHPSISLLSVYIFFPHLVHLSNFHLQFKTFPCYAFFGEDFPGQSQLSVLFV